MNSNKLRLAIFCIACTLVLAFSSSPPAGRTGAPGDGLCSDCHSNNASFGGSISLSGIPANPVPNTTYSVNVTVSVGSGSPARGGFQLVALDGTNDNQAGTWSGTGSSSSIKMGSGRQYWGHAPAQSLTGGSMSYDADWTAPNISDDVTFYVAALLGNGSGSSGDRTITSVETFTIMGSMPLELQIGSTPTTCNGNMDGTAEVTASGGIPPYEYMWSNGDDTPMIMSLSAGTYSVVVTDDNGDTMEASTDVIEPDAINVDPIIMGITCNGDANGDVDMQPSGGTGLLSCDWGFSDECKQTALSAGTYAVTVSDIVGCELVTMVTIDDVDPIMSNLAVTNADMGNNGSITAMPAGGSGSYNFSWSTGFMEDNATMSTISDLAVDDYSVTITDGNGCTTMASGSVMGSDCTLSVQAFINNIECAGDSTGAIQLVVDGASGTPTFQWSDNSTNPILLNVLSGTYSVTVSDDNCMQILDNLMVIEPDTLMANILVRVNASCDNIDNGRITLGITGGASDYDLRWSHGPTNDTLMNGLINLPDTLVELSVGTYAYTLTDGNLCTIMDSIIIGNGDILAPFLMIEEAMVLLDSMGNAPALDFSDIDMGSFDNCGIVEITFNAGPFTCADIGIQMIPVTLIDGNGNETTEMASIAIAETIAPEIECSQSTITTNSCDAVFYSVPLATDNCDVPLVELVSGLASGSIFPPGINSVTYRATDDCNNSAECSFTVTVTSDLSAEAITTAASCDDNDGTITINVTGGTPPYEILPFDNESGLSSGNYSVTVTDSQGCMTEITAVVEQSGNDVTASVETTDVSCNGAGDGSVTVFPLGGSGNYTISGDTTGLAPGTYDIIISDDNGCMITESFTINEPDSISIEFDVMVDPCLGASGSVITTIAGGVPPYQIDITSISTSESEYTITDSNGCIATFNLIVPNISPLGLSAVNIIPDTGGGTGGVTAEAVGGTPPYSYNWTDSDNNVISTEATISDIVGGEDYTVTVTDANGCIISATFVVPLVSTTADLDSLNSIADIYPNPAYSILNVVFQDKIADQITIYNIEGKQVSQIKNLTQQQSIDLSNMKSGLYMIQLKYEDNIYVKRFIKM